MPHPVPPPISNPHKICHRSRSRPPFASSVVTEDGISDHNGAILASINQAGLEEEDYSLGNSDSAFVRHTPALTP